MKKILVAEDDHDTASEIEEVLKPLAEFIKKVHTPEDLLNAIKERPPYELVTLDLSMPGCTPERGVGFIQNILIENPQTIIVVLTGYESPSLREMAMRLGAKAFIPKSESLESVKGRKGFLAQLRDVFSATERHEETVRKIEALI